MHAAFVLEQAVGALAADGKHGFLYAAQLGHVIADGFQLQAVTLGVPGVHAQQQRAKQRGLIAARSGTNFHHHVAVRVRVPGQQQNFQLMLLLRLFFFQFSDFHLGQIDHLRLGQQFFGFFQLLPGLLVGLVSLYGGLQAGPFLQQLLPAGQRGDEVRGVVERLKGETAAGEKALHLPADRFGKLLIAAYHPIKFFKHGFRHSLALLRKRESSGAM